ncbi:tetratricopeptide repeat protein [Deinococcus aquaedulcis]|uniref:tetratricopeptide repeat protein n=1 Tax=Deinococcus aquaedulcis TaxID=2840455 RepID=UPI001C835D58|nr:tetratricopeptide repeat protein [Deinococcus aquaedulcis]
MTEPLERLEDQLRRARGRERLRPLLELAAELWDKNPEDAARRAREAAALAQKLGDVAARAQALLELGRSLYRLGQYHQARQTLEDAAALHEAAGDALGLARCWMGLGTVRAALGELPQALEAHFTARTTFEAQGNEWFGSSCLNNIGLVYLRLDDHTAALDYTLRALRLATGVGNVVARMAATNNVGNALMMLGRLDEAHAYQTEALGLARQHGSPYNEIVALTNLGTLHARLSQREAALSALQQAGDLARQSHDPENLFEIYAELGHAHRLFGHPAEALAAYDQALALVGELGDFYLEASVQLSRGETLLGQGDPAAAAAALQRALELGERLGLGAVVSEAHRHLSSVYEARQELALALHHLRQHLQLTVSLAQAAAARQAAVRHLEQETERQRHLAAAQRELMAQVERASGALRGAQVAGAEVPVAEGLGEGRASPAHLDPLTGLLGRRLFEARLAREFDRARDEHLPLAVAILNLDEFGRVNHAHAHAAGDRVLRELAGLLRAQLRAADLLARDGAAFVLLLPGTAAPGAQRLCERLRETVAAWRAPDLPGLRVTVSIGLCTDTAWSQADDMLVQAEQLLYASKSAGRNRVTSDAPGAA